MPFLSLFIQVIINNDDKKIYIVWLDLDLCYSLVCARNRDLLMKNMHTLDLVLYSKASRYATSRWVDLAANHLELVPKTCNYNVIRLTSLKLDTTTYVRVGENWCPNLKSYNLSVGIKPRLSSIFAKLSLSYLKDGKRHQALFDVTL